MNSNSNMNICKETVSDCHVNIFWMVLAIDDNPDLGRKEL